MKRLKAQGAKQCNTTARSASRDPQASKNKKQRQASSKNNLTLANNLKEVLGVKELRVWKEKLCEASKVNGTHLTGWRLIYSSIDRNFE